MNFRVSWLHSVGFLLYPRVSWKAARKSEPSPRIKRTTEKYRIGFHLERKVFPTIPYSYYKTIFWLEIIYRYILDNKDEKLLHILPHFRHGNTERVNEDNQMQDDLQESPSVISFSATSLFSLVKYFKAGQI